MVISKPIRRNKKTTKSVVLIEPPRRISTHDRIINVLKDYKNGLPLTEIQYEANKSTVWEIYIIQSNSWLEQGR